MSFIFRAANQFEGIDDLLLSTSLLNRMKLVGKRPQPDVCQ